MAIGLGKRYWVRLIAYCCGDIETCMKFMQEHNRNDEHYWFELHPIVKVVNGERCSCSEYQCSLVTDNKY